jgi:uncharacterized Tic20 family protein
MSYPPHPGGGYPGGGYQPPPQHPGAQTAMILGIVAVAGGLLCGLPYVVGPFAWRKGKEVMGEIDASGGQMGGRGQAQAGYILGIVATVLLIIGVIGFVIVATTIGLGTLMGTQGG